MRALIVFESMFGNAQRTANAIAEGVSMHIPVVDVVEVSDAPSIIGDDIDLLIVGGPTHRAGLSRKSSREQAARESNRPLVSTGIGLREWFETVTHDGNTTAAAAFATSLAGLRWLRFIGSAARDLEGRLRRQGFKVVVPAEHFHVAEVHGPLLDGEYERARRWGEQIAIDVTGAAQEQHVA